MKVSPQETPVSEGAAPRDPVRDAIVFQILMQREHFELAFAAERDTGNLGSVRPVLERVVGAALAAVPPAPDAERRWSLRELRDVFYDLGNRSELRVFDASAIRNFLEELAERAAARASEGRKP
jgi:hypothetical protein